MSKESKSKLKEVAERTEANKRRNHQDIHVDQAKAQTFTATTKASGSEVGRALCRETNRGSDPRCNSAQQRGC
jgi:hypothetical protein